MSAYFVFYNRIRDAKKEPRVHLAGSVDADPLPRRNPDFLRSLRSERARDSNESLIAGSNALATDLIQSVGARAWPLGPRSMAPGHRPP